MASPNEALVRVFVRVRDGQRVEKERNETGKALERDANLFSRRRHYSEGATVELLVAEDDVVLCLTSSGLVTVAPAAWTRAESVVSESLEAPLRLEAIVVAALKVPPLTAVPEPVPEPEPDPELLLLRLPVETTWTALRYGSW